MDSWFLFPFTLDCRSKCQMPSDNISAPYVWNKLNELSNKTSCRHSFPSSAIRHRLDYFDCYALCFISYYGIFSTKLIDSSFRITHSTCICFSKLGAFLLLFPPDSLCLLSFHENNNDVALFLLGFGTNYPTPRNLQVSAF